MTDTILFYINKTRHQRNDASLFRPVTTFLRGEQRLTGTKVVCAEGACGACTVLVGRPEGTRLRYQTLNACLAPLYQIAGCHVVTVEGVADRTTFSAVQSALVAGHGAQCGFCTPGMVMTLTGYCETPPPRKELTDALCGNLCRCTGYLPILESARRIDLAAYHPIAGLYPEQQIAAELTEHRRRPAEIETDGRRLFLPTDLSEAARWKKSHPDAVISAGTTELGVQWGKHGTTPRDILSLAFVTAQAQVRCETDRLVIDAAAPWSLVEDTTHARFPALARFLRRFAGPQIKNAGTVGGQIVQASPIGDTLPLLSVLDARVEAISTSGRREIPIGDFLKTGQTALRSDELVSRVFLPLPRPGQRLRLEKVSRRQGFDRSVISAALLLTCDGGAIQDAKLAFGGLGPSVQRVPRTEAFLRGRPLTEQTLCEAGDVLRDEIAPVDDARGGAEYRSLLAANLLLRLLDEEEAA